MITGRLVAIAATITLAGWLAACGDTGRPLPAVPPPLDAPLPVPPPPAGGRADLNRRLAAFTGPDPVDCGETETRGPHAQTPAIVTPAATQAWATCAQRAVASGRAFRVVVGYPGTDWWTARGWVGDGNGIVHEFVYTVSHTAGPTIEVRECVEVSARWTRHTPFTCKPAELR